MALTEVAHDPFKSEHGKLTEVSHDPFAAAKFTPDEDTQYTPEGTALVTPSTMQAPPGGETAAKLMTDVVSAPVRAGFATAKPFADVAKWAGYEAPARALTEMDKGIKAQGPEFMGLKSPISSIASLGGDVAGLTALGGGLKTVAEKGLPFAMPTIEKAGAWLAANPYTQAALGGAGVGALGAEPNAGDATNEALAGAVLGPAAHGVLSGGASMLSPALKRFKELKDMGLSTEEILKDTTIGQVLGGGVQKIENVLGDLPFAGVRSKIAGGMKSLSESLAGKKAAADIEKETFGGKQNLKAEALDFKAAKTKQAAIDALDLEHNTALKKLEEHHTGKAQELEDLKSGFHRPFVDRALEPLGEKYAISPNVKGHEMIAEGNRNISKAYEDSLKDIGTLKLPESVKTDLRAIADLDVAALEGDGSKYHNLLKSKIESLINTTKNGNWLNPKDWQNQLSSLSKEAYAAKSPTKDVFEQNYGRALDDLKEKWIGLIEDKVGGDLFKAANKAFSEFKIPEKAASYLSSLKNAGEANPNDLLRAIASEYSTKRLAGGESELQKLAEKSFQDMKAAEKVHKEYVAKNLADFEAAKAADLARLKQSQDIAKSNVGMQKEAMVGKAEAFNAEKQAEIDRLAGGVKEATSRPGETYGEKRALFNMAGVNSLTGLGGVGLGAAIGVGPAAGVAGATLLGTNALYSKAAQDWLKNKAVAQRPQFMQDVATAIREQPAAGPLAAVESYQESRKKPGVRVYDPVTGKEITGPRGNLP